MANLPFNKESYTAQIASMAGGSSPDWQLTWGAGSLELPVTNYAEYSNEVWTNGSQPCWKFVNGTQKYVLGSVILPYDVTTTGADTITFDVVLFPLTTLAASYAEFRLEYDMPAYGATGDAAFTSLDSGDLAIPITAKLVQRYTWTDTITNLGWTSNSLIRFQFSRITPAGTEHAAEVGVISFGMRGART